MLEVQARLVFYESTIVVRTIDVRCMAVRFLDDEREELISLWRNVGLDGQRLAMGKPRHRQGEKKGDEFHGRSPHKR